MENENLYTFENPEYRKTFWHTCSHIMAQAVKRLWPEVHYCYDCGQAQIADESVLNAIKNGVERQNLIVFQPLKIS